ncbi:MAG: response regulator [Armatimonadetes bacterium]|nr:response regulator [Armatimonadota bacterium]
MRLYAKAEALCRAASVIAVATSLGVLGAWGLDSALSQITIAVRIPMDPATALSFVLLGVSLLLRRRSKQADPWARNAGQVCALIAAVVAVLSLTGFSIGSLTTQVGRPTDFGTPTVAEGVTQQTAVGILLLALGLLALDLEYRGGLRPAQLLALSAGFMGMLTLAGYAYGSYSLQETSSSQPMGPTAGMVFAILAVGLLAARPDRGLTAVIFSERPSGTMARRLLIAAFIVPMVLGWLRLEGEREGVYNTAFGIAVTVAATVVILGILIWITATSLDRIDAQRERAEVEARRAREEAVRANDAKTEFLSRMSHELRSPLQPIYTFAALIERETQSERHRRFAGDILQGGARLLELINEVLDIGKIESGHLSLSCVPVSVKDVISEAVRLTEPMAADRGVQIEVRAEREGLYILADRQRVSQVLLNLLSNAVKFNVRDGKVWIAHKQSETGWVRIEVTDTGVGVPLDRIDLLFVPFERLADDQGIAGTGLGLALSKGLVEAMGGRIGIDMTGSAGSTFYVELPAATVEPAAEPPEQAAAVRMNVAAAQAKTVLHIEDDLATIRSVEGVLSERLDIRIMVAKQGRTGVDLASQIRPDIILLDLHLPDMPGEEVLRCIRLNPELRDTPVIVLSADATPKRVKELLNAGVLAYLTKPVDVSKLLRAFSDAVHRSRLHSE